MKLHPTLIYNNILNIVENRDILDENESKKHMTIQASTCFFFFYSHKICFKEYQFHSSNIAKNDVQ